MSFGFFLFFLHSFFVELLSTEGLFTEMHLLCVRCCSKHFSCTNTLDSQPPCFTGVATEAQRGPVTCPVSQLLRGRCWTSAHIHLLQSYAVNHDVKDPPSMLKESLNLTHSTLWRPFGVPYDWSRNCFLTCRNSHSIVSHHP